MYLLYCTLIQAAWKDNFRGHECGKYGVITANPQLVIDCLTQAGEQYYSRWYWWHHCILYTIKLCNVNIHNQVYAIVPLPHSCRHKDNVYNLLLIAKLFRYNIPQSYRYKYIYLAVICKFGKVFIRITSISCYWSVYCAKWFLFRKHAFTHVMGIWEWHIISFIFYVSSMTDWLYTNSPQERFLWKNYILLIVVGNLYRQCQQLCFLLWDEVYTQHWACPSLAC